MDLYDFLNSFVTGIAGDAGLSAWADTNFGTDVKVYVDMPSIDPPTPEAGDAPFIILGQVARSNDQDRREVSYIIPAYMALYNEATKTRAESNVIEPDGIEQINDFLELVKIAVKISLPDNFSVGIDNESLLGSQPEFHAEVDFIFRQEVLIGQDPLI